jgi:UDP-N-acetylglucosamine diphosphorylase/glucosamine-1-phosphate N-acetyltransferase
MQCVVLAAGEGKRMRPLTAHRPKVMLPIGNRPMLAHLVDAVVAAGITELIMVVGYGEQSIRSWFGNGADQGISIRYVSQRRQKGTADALYTAKDLVSDRFLMLNGDMILSTDDITALMAGQPPAMGVSTTDRPEDYGVVTTKGDRVTGLEEKSREPRGNLINAGAYLFDTGIFPLLEKVQHSSRGELELTDALGHYIEEGSLTGHHLRTWRDLGHPWDLLAANESCLEGVEAVNNGTVEEGVVLKGIVSVGEGTVIKSGTYIEGPCVIGKNCRIGPHAYLRGATAIGDGCHVGHAVELKNTILLENTKVPHFNYIGDSVIGSDCNFGAGTKVANLRHDHNPVKAGGVPTGRIKMGAIIGDGVKFGINCAVNPGAVIGSGVSVAPHTLVEGVIEDNTRVR